MSMRCLMIVAVVGLFSSAAQADTYYVPGDHPTIQEAIDHCFPVWDEIIVAPGVYYENIDFLGKEILLRSTDPDDPAVVESTIIDGGGKGTVVTCANGEGPDAVLTGFVVRNGSIDYGGGMYIHGSSPTVTNCIFSGNFGVMGGGMYHHNASPAVTNCVFIGNSAANGAGMYCAEGGSPTVTNCTFHANSASSDGGGLHNHGSSVPMLANCILWGNPGGEIFNVSNPAVVTYSDVQGGYPGADNIDADPSFAWAAGGNLRPLVISPCIDAGNNAAVPPGVTTDLDGNPRFADDPHVPDSGAGTPPIVDMGAYERPGPAVVMVPGIFGGTIQAAIDWCVDGDEVIVAPGAYYEHINFHGKAITVRSTDPTDPAVVESTVIDAEFEYYHVVVCNSGEGPDTVLSGLTITGGDADGDGILTGSGAGMYNSGSSPTVTNCIFKLNRAIFTPVGRGGGMCNDNSSAPTVVNCTFENNSGHRGGGMGNFNGSTPEVRDCYFVGNLGGNPYASPPHRSGDTPDDVGGGMANFYSSPSVIGCTFENNGTNHTEGNPECGHGGGMFSLGSNPILINCVFTANYTGHGGADDSTLGEDGGCGGGMYNGVDTQPDLTGCVFWGNYTGNGAYGEFDPGGDGGHGAAMYNGAGSLPKLTACRFESNHTGDGGDASGWQDGGRGGDGAAMYNAAGCAPLITGCGFQSNVTGAGGSSEWGEDGRDGIGGGMINRYTAATVVNCVFMYNQALWGGAICNVDGSYAIVANCTFYDNLASQLGWSLYVDSGAWVANCILWHEFPATFPSIYGPATVTYSDVKGGYAGQGNIDVDPLFVDPINLNYRLLPGSPCIDSAENAAMGGTTTDADGNPRFVDDGCTEDTGLGNPPIVDMGAYEFQGNTCDLDGDGVVGVTDFLALLGAWGPCPVPCPPSCPGDFDGDCNVGVTDFLILLAGWG
jgi:hypothetical protein